MANALLCCAQGFGAPRSYIAAQAPLRWSSGEFWQLIWEQQVGVVVMISRLVEDGRVSFLFDLLTHVRASAVLTQRRCFSLQRKCEQFWPSEAPQVYGGYLVAPRSSSILAHYTHRSFAVSCVHAKKVQPWQEGSRQARCL